MEDFDIELKTENNEFKEWFNNEIKNGKNLMIRLLIEFS